MRISDSVANYILQMLNDENGIAEIQRNELANTLGCVPSQINYVITSRFTPEQGYIVESRRGGGGYIRIIRRSMTKSDLIMHIVNSIGPKLDAASMRAMLRNLVETGVAIRIRRSPDDGRAFGFGTCTGAKRNSRSTAGIDLQKHVARTKCIKSHFERTG